ncbi:MAG: tRNA (adenosine(37)-N6)-threonylcarbamoyltransferase complex transferase subunit TsaD [Myxococcota bacterium]
MRVLGIETSCDETAAAIVDEHGEVHANVVASQVREHAPYGGVVPELASRAHLRAFVPVLERALEKGGTPDAVAVTAGPGLVGALLVGTEAAKAFAFARGLPIVGVNHLDGHLLAAHLRLPGACPQPPFPFIALLVSGGHTALYRVTAPLERELLGQTRDDAAGEAFDKAAKLLKLGYPGGPIVDRLAATGDPSAVELPRPMLHRRDDDFSFSGLKTAVARHVKAHAPFDDAALADLCASFQAAIVEVLAKKAVRACVREGVPRLVLGGGVAATRGLRARAAALAEEANVELFVPPLAACTDNAAMIAYAGTMAYARGDEGPFQVYYRDPGRVRGRFRQDGSLIAPKR